MSPILEILDNPIAVIEAGFAVVYICLCAEALRERHRLKCGLYLTAAALAVALAHAICAAGR